MIIDTKKYESLTRNIIGCGMDKICIELMAIIQLEDAHLAQALKTTWKLYS